MSFNIFIAIYVIMNLYAISQVNRWFKLITSLLPLRLLLDAVLVGLALVPVAAAFVPEGPLQPTLEAAGDKWIGFLFYLTVAFLILHIIRILIWLFGGRSAAVKARRADTKARKKHAPWVGTLMLGFCILLSLTLNVYGYVHAHDVKAREYNIALEKKTVNAGELNIALVADLHLGGNSHQNHLKAMVKSINKADPDVVLFAGDIFNGNYDTLEVPDVYAGILSEIKSKQGVYAVMGDYDVKQRLLSGFPVTSPEKRVVDDRMTQFMKDAGMTLLSDQTVYINGVQIVGRRDEYRAADSRERKGVSRLISPLDTKMPIVVVQHEPTGLSSLANSGADLILCGDTHNGQILPLNFVFRFLYENSHGLKRLHGAYTLTTGGVGYTGPPIRVGTRSEVSLIHLSY